MTGPDELHWQVGAAAAQDPATVRCAGSQANVQYLSAKISRGS